MGAADLLRRPLADKYLQAAIVPANAYQHTKFQLFSSIIFGDMRVSPNKKWEFLISPDAGAVLGKKHWGGLAPLNFPSPPFFPTPFPSPHIAKVKSLYRPRAQATFSAYGVWQGLVAPTLNFKTPFLSRKLLEPGS